MLPNSAYICSEVFSAISLAEMRSIYPVHTARWNRAEPNRATLYDDTTEPCSKRPTYGWCAAMVQFSCSSVQLRSHCQRFATGPARFSSVLAHSVNVVIYLYVGM